MEARLFPVQPYPSLSLDDSACHIRGTPAVVNLLKLAGARRGILKLPGVEEDVGLIGIHWKGEFIELVPWNASVNWDIHPWGSWKVALLPCVV